MEELLFLQRITRHKEEIDHVTFQHQVSNERNGLVVSSCECVCVYVREGESLYAFVIVWVGGWVRMFFLLLPCMQKERYEGQN